MGYNTVTVTDTATKIVDAASDRQSIVIANTGSVTVYIGPDTSVTASNGTPIYSTGNFSEDNSGGRMWIGPIYAITSSGTADVRYWERTQKL